MRERVAALGGQLAAGPKPGGGFLIAGGIAGVLAGIRPARRAARLDALTALAAT
jgi:ABC-type antimicrobial peptide transport system permease subunit